MVLSRTKSKARDNYRTIITHQCILSNMNRRQLLMGAGSGLTIALAGCAADDDDTDDPEPETDDSGDDNTEEPEPADDSTEDDSEPEDGDGEAESESEEEEEADEPEEVEEPDVQSFSGSGAEVEDGIDIVGGLTVVDADHDGESNFQVSLVDDGEFDDSFVNEIGEYSGETADLTDAGGYMLDVEADGDWSIEIRQPRAGSGDELPQSLSGNGPEVFGPLEFDGTHVADGEHSGESNFQAQVYPAEGSFGESLFNEIGDYSGETTFSFDGVGWVAVQADSDWSIGLE